MLSWKQWLYHCKIPFENGRLGTSFGSTAAFRLTPNEWMVNLKQPLLQLFCISMEILVVR